MVGLEPTRAQFYDELARKHYQQLYRAMCNKCRDPDMAREAVHNAFATAMEKYDVIHSYANPGGWLMEAAKKHCLKLESRRNRDAMMLVELTEDAARYYDQDTIHYDEYIQRLEPEDRRILELYATGYTPPEIARMLGTTAAHMYVKLHRARKRLRKTIAEYKS
jgi:RNA polymerase sigma-70 factor (ECF subfamily)